MIKIEVEEGNFGVSVRKEIRETTFQQRNYGIHLLKTIDDGILPRRAGSYSSLAPTFLSVLAFLGEAWLRIQAVALV